MTQKAWWLGGSPGNFGDILTPYILDYFNIKYERVRHYKDSNLLCVGSIIRRGGAGKTILGSGILSSNERLDVTANFKLVRGPLTRDRIINLGGSCPDNYGDPGLLTSLIAPPLEKKYKIGVVPHVVDYSFIKKTLPNDRVINLKTTDPLMTAKEISECEFIVSSSLHGIIAAHSYGIPAAWVASENKLKGDDIKFYDYFASVGIDKPTKTTMYNPRYVLPSINKENIIESFKDFKLKNSQV